MEWSQIKESIIQDLSSRGLKDPNVRLRALGNIEELLQTSLPEYINDPQNFDTIGKEEFKIKLGSIKGRDLNGAEKSIVNEIYYRIQPTLLVTCPGCRQQLIVPKSIENHPNIACLICGKNFKNPLLPQPSPKNSKTIGFIMLFIIIASIIGFCTNSGASDDEAYVMGKNYVKERLNSPSTAKFPASGSSEVRIQHEGNIWFINGPVDSQNAYGAIVRTQYDIAIEFLGNNEWRLLEMDLYQDYKLIYSYPYSSDSFFTN